MFISLPGTPMNTCLTSHFSVSSIASTEPASSTNGCEAATEVRTSLERASHARLSGPLAALSSINRKTGTVDDAVIQSVVRVRMERARIVTIPPHRNQPEVSQKPVGLQSNSSINSSIASARDSLEIMRSKFSKQTCHNPMLDNISEVDRNREHTLAKLEGGLSKHDDLVERDEASRNAINRRLKCVFRRT